MLDLVTTLPVRRPDLVVRPLGEKGQYVIKDPRSGAYFTLGEQEHFLLFQLEGRNDAEGICRAFHDRFGEPLPESDLHDFVQMANAQGFLLPPGSVVAARPDQTPAPMAALPALPEPPAAKPPPARPVTPAPSVPPPTPHRARQSILYWRRSIFDPDRFFNRVVPSLGFLWTVPFLVLSLGMIGSAAVLVWLNRQDLVTSFASAWRWETLILVWIMLIFVTTCHELAHGMTCKHFGGEVHEIGFLLMFFLPCFYCNVSDAWLIREKWKRLWITLAGGYCDLCLGALAVFVWRLTLPQSLPNYLAYVLLTILGTRVFFNFTPLVKLDGYYLVSDWLEIPNMQGRARGYLFAWLRWLLWGAERPTPDPWGKLLVVYGVANWCFSLGLMVMMLVGLVRFTGERWRLVGIAAAVLLGSLALGSFFHGFSQGEVHLMLTTRRKRVVLWLLIVAAIPTALWLIPWEDRASGPFQIRPTQRTEVRAPVAGFLIDAPFEEGERVTAGALVARLEVPDLCSRIAQKNAELREAQAKVYLLERGPRPEEVAEQRHAVARAEQWCRQAEEDLKRARRSLQEDLARLDKQIDQYVAQQAYTGALVTRNQRLREGGAASEQEYQEALKQRRVDESMEQQARAQKRSLAAKGTLEAEVELGRRQKELADARGKLVLLEAGTRPEEIEVEHARMSRLQEEVQYLEQLRKKQKVCAPLVGVITTPHLRDKIGQYLHEGDLICVIEEPGGLEAEIALAEEDVARAQVDHRVELKVRALPFKTFNGRVSRIAPAALRIDPPPGAPTTYAARIETPGTVTVYCRVDEASTEVRPGMTGYARVYTHRRPVGEVLLERLLRYVRTEFWW